VPKTSRLRAAVTGVVATVVAVSSMGCGKTSDEPPITPPAPRGKSIEVDACELLPQRSASALIDRPLRMVGQRVQPPRLETLTCDLGVRFADPVVSVELTTDPVAQVIFEQAYGEEAGGNPVRVKRLPALGIFRSEGDEQSIHVYVRGAVLAVRSNLALRPPLSRSELVDLARLATRRLPKNPVLRETAQLDRCAAVDSDAVTRALDRPVSLAQEFASGLDVQCSWGGQPGAVTVSVTTDEATLRRWRATVDDAASYVAVPWPDTSGDVRAYSSREVAGDLVVLDDAHLLRVSLTPSAGFSEADIETTPAELDLAADVVRAYFASP